MNCIHCKRKITWEDQRYAFGHLRRAGYDRDILKSIFPSHLKCAKQWIKDNKIQKSTEVVNATSAT